MVALAKATERRGRVFNTPSSYRKIPGSYLFQEAGYPDWGVRGFSQFLQASAGIIPQN
jgi:hypothetical protein